MFIEPYWTKDRRGWIEVICGSMFSGKTEELIRRLKRACIANLKTEIFKPAVDTRFADRDIVSHDARAVPSTPISNSQELLLLTKDIDVVGIDEAQFFDAELPFVCDQLALKGVRVIVAGLDMDFRGNPFGPLPALLAKADYITKLHAICVRCGHIASYSYRTSAEVGQLLLGEADRYEPRCRECFQLGSNAPGPQ
jgi:thymidine kinase